MCQIKKSKVFQKKITKAKKQKQNNNKHTNTHTNQNRKKELDNNIIIITYY